ncbi:MAG: hypothetical protein AMS15_02070 [Planctomycetes bacterium DG_23]|nr:MAG: hypothetical protein AMS15_02070 [Planctomycetes bacterium DG_23]
MSSEEKKQPKKKAKWRRRLKWVIYLVAIYSVISFIYSLIPETALEVNFLQEKKIALQGPLLAGFAKSEITPPAHLWEKLNIYGQKPPISGVHDRIFARALVVSSPESRERIAIVSCDLLIITKDLKEAVLKKLEGKVNGETELLLAATHTHTTIGNYWDNNIGQRVLGKYSPEFSSFLAERIAYVVAQAGENAQPAQMAYVKEEVHGLSKSRRARDPASGERSPIDRELAVIKFASAEQEALGYIISFPAHPVTLYRRTQGKISGDYPGFLANSVEEEGGVAIFLSGALGGVRSTAPGPNDEYKGEKEPFAKALKQADLLTQEVRRLYQNLETRPVSSAVSLSATIELPAADIHFLPEERPFTGLRFYGAIPAKIFSLLADYFVLPDETELQMVKIDDIIFLATPADLSNAVGRELKETLSGFVLPLSHCNDYALGYVPSRAEYDMGGVFSGSAAYERFMDFYGKRTAPFLIQAFLKMQIRLDSSSAD